MKNKTKYKRQNSIAKKISKHYWNNVATPPNRKLIIQLFLNMLDSIDYDYFYLDTQQYEEISKLNWKELVLFNSEVPGKLLRESIQYYLGIGDYENDRSRDKKYQDIYKEKLEQSTRVSKIKRLIE